MAKLPRRLGLSVLFVLCHALGDPLPATCDGSLLGSHRARIRVVGIPANALDVAALRGAVGQGTRGLVSMVGHAARFSHQLVAVGSVGPPSSGWAL